jgi:hypothetical protein
MKLIATLASGALAIALSASAGLAAPLSVPSPAAHDASIVEQVQGYGHGYGRPHVEKRIYIDPPRHVERRVHVEPRPCHWSPRGWYRVDRWGRWHACRPAHPGRGWVWHSEGPRHGWYHPHRRQWHYNKW